MNRDREELEARLKELRDEERERRARSLALAPVSLPPCMVANDVRPKSNVIAVRFGLNPHRAYELYRAASEIDEDPACFNRAEALYRESIRRDPSLAISYTNLANIRWRRGDRLEAVELYREALVIDPRQPEAHYNLGYVLLDYGDVTGAITELRLAIDYDPKFADAHWNMAMALTQIGKDSLAKNYWHAYLDLEPDGAWSEMARQHLYGNARRQR